MGAFFIGFFSAMGFTGFIAAALFLKDAFKSGFVLGD